MWVKFIIPTVYPSRLLSHQYGVVLCCFYVWTGIRALMVSTWDYCSPSTREC